MFLGRPSTTPVHFVSEEDLQVYESRASGNAMELDVSNVYDDRDLFATVSKAMSFPDYFGENWDALDECLSDLEWLPETGFILVVKGASKAWSRNPKMMGMFTNSWLEANEYWIKQGTPFHLVFIV